MCEKEERPKEVPRDWLHPRRGKNGKVSSVVFDDTREGLGPAGEAYNIYTDAHANLSEPDRERKMAEAAKRFKDLTGFHRQ